VVPIFFRPPGYFYEKLPHTSKNRKTPHMWGMG
jgi:hypothetical protein